MSVLNETLRGTAIEHLPAGALKAAMIGNQWVTYYRAGYFCQPPGTGVSADPEVMRHPHR
jgi:hypothetical protein